MFGRLLDVLETIQRDLPIIFPVHPRTRNNLKTSGLERAGRRCVAEKFSTSAIVTEHVRVIEEVLSSLPERNRKTEAERRYDR